MENISELVVLTPYLLTIYLHTEIDHSCDRIALPVPMLPLLPVASTGDMASRKGATLHTSNPGHKWAT